MRTLTEKKVAQLKADLASGRFTQPQLATKYGISRSLVSDIANGRAHASVPWPDGVTPPSRKPGGQRKTVLHDPTDERILELESEVIHLKDELARETKRVKANAKVAGLFKAIVHEMDGRISRLEPLPPAWTSTVPNGRITEHCVLHMSDGHHDAVVTPEECDGLEDHNFLVSCARAERYVDRVLDWTQNTLSPTFHFPVLWVLAYGDFSSGEIHGAVQRSYYRNQFKNCLAIGQLHGLMYRDLAAHFETVNVLYLAGNHGRRTNKKDYHGAHDNWDYLVAETSRLHCQGLENVNFLIPNAWIANVEINGVGFHVSHGDDVRSNMAIPWYGMTRRQRGLIALGAVRGGLRPRYFCVGHHHTASSLSDIDGELLVNGAWVATDAFSYNALTGYREPSQWCHGVNPKYGITWRLNVKLKHSGEASGPQRYLIDGGRDVGPLLQ
jgi:hypothetical protein